jgi:hypothetical protein
MTIPATLGGPRVAALFNDALRMNPTLRKVEVVRQAGASTSNEPKHLRWLAALLVGRPVIGHVVLRWAKVLGCDVEQVLRAAEEDQAEVDGRKRTEQEERERLSRQLLDNVALLLRHRERIRGEPRLAAVTHPHAMLSCAYIGGGLLPMGALLELWEGAWTATCPDCAGLVFITSVGGSVLSGSHGWSGVCSACERVVSYRDAAGSRALPHATSFASLWQPARPLVVRPVPATVLLRGTVVVVTGIVSQGPTPAVEAMDEPPALTFEELIEELRARGT